VALIARGYSNREIAKELTIAEATAVRHVANILDKLGLKSRARSPTGRLSDGFDPASRASTRAEAEWSETGRLDTFGHLRCRERPTNDGLFWRCLCQHRRLGCDHLPAAKGMSLHITAL
jgi:hypothetical protein